jgi:hypothetical protein
MIENAKLDRLLTQVNCRITSIARLRDAGAISNRKAEQELKKAVELRAKVMGQIDRQNFPFERLEPDQHRIGGGGIITPESVCAIAVPRLGLRSRSTVGRKSFPRFPP